VTARDFRPKAAAGLAVITAFAAAIGVLAAAAWTPGAAAPAPTRPLLIKAREFVFEPKEVTVRSGEITFEVKNEGAIEHNFVLEDSAQKRVAQIAVIEAGKTEDLKVMLRPGTFAIVCNLPGHKDAGMTGTLRVQP
jgi:uncharacterized cupredoxin-like copper-binding protein